MIIHPTTLQFMFLFSLLEVFINMLLVTSVYYYKFSSISGLLLSLSLLLIIVFKVFRTSIRGFLVFVKLHCYWLEVIY